MIKGTREKDLNSWHPLYDAFLTILRGQIVTFINIYQNYNNFYCYNLRKCIGCLEELSNEKFEEFRVLKTSQIQLQQQ